MFGAISCIKIGRLLYGRPQGESMRSILITLFALLIPFGAKAIDLSYYAQNYNPFSTCNPPAPYAIEVFKEVLKTARTYANIPPVTFCRNDFVPNAYAQVFGVPQNIQLPNGFWVQQMMPIYRIDYNPNFMGQADVSVNNKFAIVGILAHEIGHIEHFSHVGNPSDPASWKANYDLNVPWEKELRADEFSGYVLAKMGASTKDVVDTQRTIFSLHINPNYADSVTRLRRMFSGYRAGKDGGLSDKELNEVIEAQTNIANQYLRW